MKLVQIGLACLLSSYLFASIDEHLVAHYTFNNNAKDALGLNDALAYGIDYANFSAKFSQTKESRLEIPFKFMPTSGSLFMNIYIDSAYDYIDPTYNNTPELRTNNSCALLFTTDIQHGDVSYAGSTWLYGCNNGDISLIMATSKYMQTPSQTLSVSGTEFSFLKWHNIGISYGVGGQALYLNGRLIASNSNNTQILGAGGNREVALDVPTIGESVSSFWNNNQWEGGFNGYVDDLRLYDAMPTVAKVASIFANDKKASVGVRKDFNQDGFSDILWRNESDGSNVLWIMDKTSYKSYVVLPTVSDTEWKVVAIEDLDNDGNQDIIWRHAISGQNVVWKMDGMQKKSLSYLKAVKDSNWQIKAIADFDLDGKRDILWHNKATGAVIFWKMDGFKYLSHHYIKRVADTNWEVSEVADFDGDGDMDILWRNKESGLILVWEMEATRYKRYVLVKKVSTDWEIKGVGSFTDSNARNIVFRNEQSGQNLVWKMNSFAYESYTMLPSVNSTEWSMYGKAQQNVIESAETPENQSSSGGIDKDVSNDVYNAVRKHNELRAKYYSGYEISWDSTLAQSAQAYANTLAKSGAFEHDVNRIYGENLYTSTADASFFEAAYYWAKEEKYYNYSTNSCQSGQMCRHFTQMIWKSSTKLGCGRAVYEKGTRTGWTVVVCHYSPTGNISYQRPY